MLIRIATVTLNDRLQVPLPTYEIKGHDPAVGWALVDVPAEDIPDVPELRAALQATVGGNLKRRRGVRLLLDAWYQHLDTRYAERAGHFRPMLAV